MMTPIRLSLSRRLRNQIVDAGKANQAEQQRHPREELPAKIAGAPRGYESAKTDIHNDEPGGKAGGRRCGADRRRRQKDGARTSEPI
jgi:hypothetical protein